MLTFELTIRLNLVTLTGFIKRDGVELILMLIMESLKNLRIKESEILI